jgi:hypothetical protein
VHPNSRRLITFVIGVGATAAAAEAFVRWREPAFAAAANRVRTKMEILDQHGPVEVLFFGTSRMQDAVSPRLFAEELISLQPALRVTGFNFGFTSSNLPSLEALASRYSGRPGLRLAVLELSSPQIEDGPLVWEEAPGETDRSEDRLTAWTHARAKVIADRKAFVADNLVRLPGLLWFAPALDGSEKHLQEEIGALFNRHEPLPSKIDDSLLGTTRWTGREPLGTVAAPTALANRLAAVAQRFSSKGERAVFVVPPLRRDFRFPTEREASMKTLFREVALRSAATVLDYSGVELPDGDFYDESHLAPPGRAQFSVALATEVVEASLLEGPSGR